MANSAELRASLASLDLTHAQLAKELSRARDEWERNGTYVTGELPASVEAFVHALYQIQGMQDELCRRAKLVASLCGEGSPYERARGQVLADNWEPTGKLAGMLTRQLRGIPPTSVTTLSQVRESIERLQAGGSSRDGLEQWRIACVDVIRQARLEQADGCHTLYHVYAAMGADPTELSLAVKAMLCGGTIGGALLEDVQAAADALVTMAYTHVPKHYEETFDEFDECDEYGERSADVRTDSCGWRS